MAVYFHENAVLFNSGQVAFDEACCCDSSPVYCQNCSVLTPSDRPVLTVNGLVNGVWHQISPPAYKTCYDCGNGDCPSWDGVSMATTSFTNSCGQGQQCSWRTDQVTLKCYRHISCGDILNSGLYLTLCLGLDPADNTQCLAEGLFYAGPSNWIKYQARVTANVGFTSSPIVMSYHSQGSNQICYAASGSTMVATW